MHRRQRKNERVHRTAVQVVGFALMFVLASVAAVGPSRAQQHKTFTATPLTTQLNTVSTAKQNLPRPTNTTSQVQPGSAKRAANSQMKPAVVSTACDVTIAPGASPAGGYLSLSAFGIAPVAGVGDDTITNFSTPAYTFAGETYTRIAFASNGYAIIGGTSDPGDNTTINQSFPDPTRPNNVLAPFWTDLDPNSGGALRIATLTDGADTWIVLDWEAVSEFATINQNSFEIWIGQNNDAHPAQDVSYAYGTLQGSGHGGFLTVGAENKIGTHGQNYYYNGTGTLPVNGTQLVVSATSCTETTPFTAVGSAGTLDEDSLSSASVLNFVLGFNPGTTGTITARYNISPTLGISRYCPATSSHVAVRFRDSDSAAAGGQIIMTIHRTSIATGGNVTIFTFDSNVSSQPVGANFQTFETNVPIDFDFGSNIYWIEAQVIRADPNVLVHLGSIQVYERDGTPCP